MLTIVKFNNDQLLFRLTFPLLIMLVVVAKPRAALRVLSSKLKNSLTRDYE